MSRPRLFRAATAAAAEPVLDVAGRLVPVRIRRSATARRLTLRADALAGRLSITLPGRMGQAMADQLLAHHQGWIETMVAGWPRPRPFEPGQAFPYLGETLRLDWREDASRAPSIVDGRLSVGGARSGLAVRVERFLRSRARARLAASTEAMLGRLEALGHGRPPATVRVGDPRGRWGSCSGEGRLRYSWRLVLAPPFVAESVVAHEVAHLVHMNHTPEFHALACQIHGADPAAPRRWLRAHGAALHWVGRAG